LEKELPKLSAPIVFLGIEEDAFTNADIHPEYVTTVEVAKKLTAPDRVVRACQEIGESGSLTE